MLDDVVPRITLSANEVVLFGIALSPLNTSDEEPPGLSMIGMLITRLDCAKVALNRWVAPLPETCSTLLSPMVSGAAVNAVAALVSPIWKSAEVVVGAPVAEVHAPALRMPLSFIPKVRFLI